MYFYKRREFVRSCIYIEFVLAFILILTIIAWMESEKAIELFHKEFEIAIKEKKNFEIKIEIENFEIFMISKSIDNTDLKSEFLIPFTESETSAKIEKTFNNKKLSCLIFSDFDSKKDIFKSAKVDFNNLKAQIDKLSKIISLGLILRGKSPFKFFIKLSQVILHIFDRKIEQKNICILKMIEVFKSKILQIKFKKDHKFDFINDKKFDFESKDTTKNYQVLDYMTFILFICKLNGKDFIKNRKQDDPNKENIQIPLYHNIVKYLKKFYNFFIPIRNQPSNRTDVTSRISDTIREYRVEEIDLNPLILHSNHLANSTPLNEHRSREILTDTVLASESHILNNNIYSPEYFNSTDLNITARDIPGTANAFIAPLDFISNINNSENQNSSSSSNSANCTDLKDILKNSEAMPIDLSSNISSNLIMEDEDISEAVCLQMNENLSQTILSESFLRLQPEQETEEEFLNNSKPMNSNNESKIPDLEDSEGFIQQNLKSNSPRIMASQENIVPLSFSSKEALNELIKCESRYSLPHLEDSDTTPLNNLQTAIIQTQETDNLNQILQITNSDENVSCISNILSESSFQLSINNSNSSNIIYPSGSNNEDLETSISTSRHNISPNNQTNTMHSPTIFRPQIEPVRSHSQQNLYESDTLLQPKTPETSDISHTNTCFANTTGILDDNSFEYLDESDSACVIQENASLTVQNITNALICDQPIIYTAEKQQDKYMHQNRYTPSNHVYLHSH
ncbi:hypothetical protein CWI36_1440p0010 [Hamiltosporidium magnivora]|uniref:Uncharacterized protein n=2 Tax=Hamiltosporidium magnivora TaxID=148818 RepID=A0A4Q9L1X8_9MICR|nr:hypothetical protein CWI36_1440p0010 [Hamiltosporidium magnivora]